MKSLRHGQQLDPLRCAERVHCEGRGVSFYQCQRKCGHGPEGRYCSQHAMEHDKSPAKLAVWRVETRGFGDKVPLPERVAARHVTKSQFIDSLGRRNSRVSDWASYFDTEEEALRNVQKRLEYDIVSAHRKIRRASSALNKVSKRLARVKKEGVGK